MSEQEIYDLKQSVSLIGLKIDKTDAKIDETDKKIDKLCTFLKADAEFGQEGFFNKVNRHDDELKKIKEDKIIQDTKIKTITWLGAKAGTFSGIAGGAIMAVILWVLKKLSIIGF